MTVFELNKDELNELKSAYFWNEETQDILKDCYSCPEDIPDDIICNYYEGIMFVKEDFFCNITDNNYENCHCFLIEKLEKLE